MHTEMWENPATLANVESIAERGYIVVGPETGRLTGSDSGVGRLSEVEEIVAAVLSQLAPQDFAGASVVVSAGGTREPIDPVRFIGNRSTGAMGVQLATAFTRRGATVTLIGANLEVSVPRGIKVVSVSSAREMEEAVEKFAGGADVFVSAAAVGDYRVGNASADKLSKDRGLPTLQLVENPDILKNFCATKGETFVVGFAAETSASDLVDRASVKARAKGVDLMVANLVGDTTGFGNTETDIVLLDGSGNVVSNFHGSKSGAAGHILDYVSRQRAAKQ
jgi:phosphopantothenoylcysteine decarboxylase/phosphopantothenate--cysteine ligase